MVGGLVVIALLAVLVWRGLRTARLARDSYGFLLALGVTCWLSYQSLINIAVITAVVPFTGIPLPFLSYGGSSMLISLIGVGILLNVSRDAALTRKTQTKPRATARRQHKPRTRATVAASETAVLPTEVRSQTPTSVP